MLLNFNTDRLVSDKKYVVLHEGPTQRMDGALYQRSSKRFVYWYPL